MEISSRVPSTDSSVVIAEAVSGPELDLTAGHPSGADLGSREVLEEGQGLPQAGLDLPGRAHHLGVLLVAPVGEVEAQDVGPGLDQTFEHPGVTGGRADGGDDLRAAHGSGEYTVPVARFDTPRGRTLYSGVGHRPWTHHPPFFTVRQDPSLDRLTL